jgi:hypothetical protein
VPGGKYQLKIELHEAGGSLPFTQPLIGSLTKELDVPGSPGGRSDEPWDLGVLAMTARHSLKAGTAAPDFTVKTVDGQPLKLADFKGKPWCGRKPSPPSALFP